MTQNSADVRRNALLSKMPLEVAGFRLRKTDQRDVDLRMQISNDPDVRKYVGPIKDNREKKRSTKSFDGRRRWQAYLL
jgi:hypothetical protein